MKSYDFIFKSAINLKIKSEKGLSFPPAKYKVESVNAMRCANKAFHKGRGSCYYLTEI